MDIMKVGTLNVQNSKINRSGGITLEGVDNIQILAKHIQKIKMYYLPILAYCPGFQTIRKIYSKV